MKYLKLLIKIDIKTMLNDYILLLTVIAPVLLMFVLKYGVPIINQALVDRYAFHLTDYYPLILGITLMLLPMLIGCMSSFVLLEDYDEGLLTYYSVTPLSKERYLLYRIGLPILFNIIFSLILIYFTNLVSLPFIQALFIILLASTQTIIITLFIVSYAANRVEGLALSKMAGVAIFLPLLEILLKTKLKYGIMMSPTYYIPALIVHFDQISYFIILLLLGSLVHLLFIYALFQRFQNKI